MSIIAWWGDGCASVLCDECHVVFHSLPDDNLTETTRCPSCMWREITTESYKDYPYWENDYDRFPILPSDQKISGATVDTKTEVGTHPLLRVLGGSGSGYVSGRKVLGVVR